MTDHPQRSTSAPLRLIPRRRFVQGSAVLAGGVSAALVASPDALAAPNLHRHWNRWLAQQGDGTPVSVDDYAPVALTDVELTTLTAAIDRLIPPDDIGPGAAEAGVAIYIDRLLAGSGATFLSIYQDGLAALDGTDGDFATMSAADQDTLLTSVEAGDVADAPAGFFPLMLEHTRQGMFGDPIHGGNREFAGWDLIRYPGIKLVWSEDDQAIGTEVAPEHTSVEAYGGMA